MNITVDVDAVELTSVIGERYELDDDGDRIKVQRTLGDAIADRIAGQLLADDSYKSLRQRVVEERADEITKQARKHVEEILAEAIATPVQRTNGYGSPVGGPVTVTELIVAEAREVLSKRSDYGRGQTYVDKVVAEMVDKAMKKELAETIADEKAKVVAAVRAKAADLIATAVKEGIGR